MLNNALKPNLLNELWDSEVSCLGTLEKRSGLHHKSKSTMRNCHIPCVIIFISKSSDITLFSMPFLLSCLSSIAPVEQHKDFHIVSKTKLKKTDKTQVSVYVPVSSGALQYSSTLNTPCHLKGNAGYNTLHLLKRGYTYESTLKW